MPLYGTQFQFCIRKERGEGGERGVTTTARNRVHGLLHKDPRELGECDLYQDSSGCLLRSVPYTSSSEEWRRERKNGMTGTDRQLNLDPLSTCYLCMSWPTLSHL